MSNSLILLGLQFGDEGKGKIADFLGNRFDAGVRFNGANNAGHTVVVGENKLPLSHLPSSVLSGHPVLIAQGCSISPSTLLKEIEKVKTFSSSFKLSIDPRCHVIMPYHVALDEASEEYRSQKVGSLKLGVGFSYEDKTNRDGIRLVDLLDKEILASKINEVWELKKRRLEHVYGKSTKLNVSEIVEQYLHYGKLLSKYFRPVAEVIIENFQTSKYLFESAQAFYLDYSFGTYPFTVAYNTLASSVFPNVGLPPLEIDVLGIVRAYTIRVGSGPFPTEQENESGAKLREVGHEYGTISKRPRRCGWLDLPMLKYAIKMNGVKEIALTKLDVLSSFENIRVCTSYDENDQPGQIFNLLSVRPIYKDLPGWSTDISSARKYSELPKNCQNYVQFIEDELQIPVRIISVGPERSQTIEII